MTTKTKVILGLLATFVLSASLSAVFVFVSQSPPKPTLTNRQTAALMNEVPYVNLPGAVLPAQTILPSPTPTPPQSVSRPQIKGEVTIALLGDSMIDTLAPLDQLNNSLTQIYPNVKFKLLNYGVGATDIKYALTRLTQSYRYKDQDVLALISQKPDLVILESFAYNHPSNDQTGIAAQNDGYLQIINQLRQTGIKVAMLTTIAPNTALYAQGASDVNFTDEQRANEVLTINNFLKNAIRFAKDNNLPLIDAYTPSLTSKDGGNLLYVNSTDHIHPSPEGAEFISDLVAKTLSKQNLIEQIIETKK